MEKIKIQVVIPSSKRHIDISTPFYFKQSVVCVAESELYKYKFYNPNFEFVTHPDSIIGLANKRNWILDNFENVLMLDDDLAGMRRMYVNKNEQALMTPDEANEMIQFCGNMAKMTGCYLFGFSLYGMPKTYYSTRPIKLTGHINGCALGMLKGSGLRFSPETVAVEDYYMTGLNAYVHRKAFIDTRFYFVQDGVGDRAGGQAQHRTALTERADTLLLRRKFGEAIRLKKATSAASKRNEFGRTITIPF